MTIGRIRRKGLRLGIGHPVKEVPVLVILGGVALTEIVKATTMFWRLETRRGVTALMFADSTVRFWRAGFCSTPTTALL